MRDRFGAVAIADITKAELQKHLAERLRFVQTGADRSPASGRGEVVGKAFTYGKAVFEFAVRHEYITRNPMASMTRPVPKAPERKATRPPTDAELRALWDGAERH